jgi:hypothetical protein
VSPEKPADESEKKVGENAGGEQGVGPRFKKGSEDLDQLEGIEEQQERSRRAQRKNEQDDSGEAPADEDTYPAIDEIEKSKQRVKNRFKRIKDYGDAIDEFDC